MLHTAKNKETYLNSLHPRYLRKILSVLTNKTILPVTPRRLTKPTIYLQHTLPPNNNIKKQHQLIKKSLNPQQIKQYILLTTTTLQQKLSPTIKKQKLKIPIPINYVSAHVNRKTFKYIFTQAQNLLPNNIKEKIDTSIVYKNLNNTGSLFFNYKDTALTPVTENLNSIPKCPCHMTYFKQFLNKHNHIDTNDTDILNKLETYLQLKPTNITELANKGANFIIQPYNSPAIFQKYLSKDINHFITKIATQYKLPTYIFQEWKKYLLQQFNIISTKIPTTKANYDQHNIKTNLTAIQKTVTITPTDKMKNNFRFTCSEYTKRIIAQKITTEKILLENPNTNPLANIENNTAKQAYTQTTLNYNQTIQIHNNFLTQYQLTNNYNQLPFLYIIHKAHKHGNRAVTAAAKVTTTLLAKTPHSTPLYHQRTSKRRQSTPTNSQHKPTLAHRQCSRRQLFNPPNKHLQ